MSLGLKELIKLGWHDFMSETAEQQRERILDQISVGYKESAAWGYDLAVELGYEPESWDGMWKLQGTGFGETPFTAVADESLPFEYGHMTLHLTPETGYIIAHEVCTDIPTEFRMKNDKEMTRPIKHPIPQGWIICCDAQGHILNAYKKKLDQEIPTPL